MLPEEWTGGQQILFRLMVGVDQNIVWTHYLLDTTCFNPTLFGPNVYDPTFFKKPKLLLTTICPTNFLIKTKVDLKFFGSNFVCTRVFSKLNQRVF